MHYTIDRGSNGTRGALDGLHAPEKVFKVAPLLSIAVNIIVEFPYA